MPACFGLGVFLIGFVKREFSSKVIYFLRTLLYPLLMVSCRLKKSNCSIFSSGAFSSWILNILPFFILVIFRTNGSASSCWCSCEIYFLELIFFLTVKEFCSFHSSASIGSDPSSNIVGPVPMLRSDGPL